MMKKRSVHLHKRRTSVSLEDEFWQALKDSAIAQAKSINVLIEEIGASKRGNLSSAIRLYVLGRAQAAVHAA